MHLNPRRFQDVAQVLGELLESKDFRALWDSTDAPSEEFRRGVEWTETRCYTLEPEGPTDHEIESWLIHLRSLTHGPLARFERSINLALDALHEM